MTIIISFFAQPRELVKQCVKLGLILASASRSRRTELEETAVTRENLECFQKITESPAFPGGL